MAFTNTFVSNKTQQLNTTYNLDWPVGRLGTNMSEDVMLVQALSNMLYWELKGLTADAGLTAPPGETAPLTVDGIMGPFTQKYISNFQSQLMARGVSSSCDGTFDPARQYYALTSRTHEKYQIKVLNDLCFWTCSSRGMRNYDNLAAREDIPIQLRSALRTVKATARKYQHG